jgi:hypothetical protein
MIFWLFEEPFSPYLPMLFGDWKCFFNFDENHKGEKQILR